MSAVSAASAGPGGPPLRIVRGDPTPEEIAVVTAVVTAAAGADPGAGPAERVRRGGWNDPSALHRRTLLPGPNAWRASTLPR